MSLDRDISASLLRLRLRAPFFATLAMHARFHESTEVPTMATDGRDVFVNAKFAASLSAAEFDGVLVHEVLHAALGHVARRGTRDPKQWNVAADIVVNGLVLGNGFSLPDGGLRDVALENFSVEEVFALLQSNDQQHEPVDLDLLETAPGDVRSGQSGDAPGADSDQAGTSVGTGSTRNGAAELERHWRKATAQATAVGRGHGSMPSGVARAFSLAEIPTLDWRSVLWRFLTPTATDFAAFDRRHLYRGLYLETLEDQNVRIAVAVDTSGSIDDDLVASLMNEVRAVLRSYPGIECQLYYADAALYGPWLVGVADEIPPPQGGGGTDFRPFFEAVTAGGDFDGAAPSLCVYLTDGFGDFPDEAPPIPVLWAVVPGGLADDQFPFGEVARLVE